MVLLLTRSPAKEEPRFFHLGQRNGGWVRPRPEVRELVLILNVIVHLNQRGTHLAFKVKSGTLQGLLLDGF